MNLFSVDFTVWSSSIEMDIQENDHQYIEILVVQNKMIASFILVIRLLFYQSKVSIVVNTKTNLPFII